MEFAIEFFVFALVPVYGFLFLKVLEDGLKSIADAIRETKKENKNIESGD